MSSQKNLSPNAFVAETISPPANLVTLSEIRDLFPIFCESTFNDLSKEHKKSSLEHIFIHKGAFGSLPRLLKSYGNKRLSLAEFRPYPQRFSTELLQRACVPQGAMAEDAISILDFAVACCASYYFIDRILYITPVKWDKKAARKLRFSSEEIQQSLTILDIVKEYALESNNKLPAKCVSHSLDVTSIENICKINNLLQSALGVPQNAITQQNEAFQEHYSNNIIATTHSSTSSSSSIQGQNVQENNLHRLIKCPQYLKFDCNQHVSTDFHSLDSEALEALLTPIRNRSSYYDMTRVITNENTNDTNFTLNSNIIKLARKIVDNPTWLDMNDNDSNALGNTVTLLGKLLGRDAKQFLKTYDIRDFIESQAEWHIFINMHPDPALLFNENVRQICRATRVSEVQGSKALVNLYRMFREENSKFTAITSDAATQEIANGVHTLSSLSHLWDTNKARFEAQFSFSTSPMPGNTASWRSRTSPSSSLQPVHGKRKRDSQASWEHVVER